SGFFSLKWKTLLVLSLALVIVNAGFAYLVYAKAAAQFDAAQANKRLTQAREFEALMSKAFDSMSIFASFIPRLSTPQTGSLLQQEQHILAALSEHGMLLDFEWGVEGVHFFAGDRMARAAVSWPDGREAPQVESLLRLVQRDEAPHGRLACEKRCMQLIVVPVLQRSQTVGFLLVERSIGDSLKDFHLFSGADIALLRRPSAGTDSPGADAQSWKRDLVGITHEERVLPVLDALTHQLSQGVLPEHPYRIPVGAEWYEVFASPVALSEPDVTALVVNRVTGQVQAIREATTHSFVLGLAGLLFSEVILLGLMWGPMQRIQDVVFALPLLAERSHSRLRRELPDFPRDGLPRDEIDVMVDAIKRVSEGIEMLDEANAAAGEALRESEQSLQLAQAMARVASWTGRPVEGRFDISQGASRIHGLLAHVNTWAEFLAFVHPEDKRAVLKAWRGGRPGGSMDVEFRLLIGERQLDIHAIAEFDVVGAERALRAVGMMQDVSEVRTVQRALARHRDHLEAEVRERTGELVAARNRAQKQAQTKSRFLADMSHEIRTPLNAVLGLAQVGLQQSQNRRVATTFEQILEAGEHLLNIANDVLDLSKIEAGKLVIEEQPFKLRKAVLQSAAMLKPRIDLKGLDMPVVIAADVPERVIGDGFRLQQILINLLSNAVKFTEHGRVTLDVSRGGDNYSFKVKDTGIGMSAAQIARLFKPFDQGSDPSGRNREGTGLGLSISNTLAILMGGDILVHSESGAGSEFELRLPLREVQDSVEVPVDDRLPVAGQGTHLNGVRVLVADDAQINLTVVESLLRAEGAEVTTVGNGKDALTAVLNGGQERFHVVLMDVQMPQMDGRQATRSMRKAGAQVPVIGLTAHVSPEERKASLAAGMHDQLVKPVMQDVLVRTILNYVSGHRSPPPLRKSSLH
ncbi:MAG: response regulator, partial [Chromatiaceae bacterium]|nr:response regulator [Chromatiaceae bacterium]